MLVKRKIASPCRDSNLRSFSPYPSAILLRYPGAYVARTVEVRNAHESLTAKPHFGDTGLDGRIILKYILGWNRV
jgi:hypothetical protein